MADAYALNTIAGGAGMLALVPPLAPVAGPVSVGAGFLALADAGLNGEATIGDYLFEVGTNVPLASAAKLMKAASSDTVTAAGFVVSRGQAAAGIADDFNEATKSYREADRKGRSPTGEISVVRVEGRLDSRRQSEDLNRDP